jgi:hypothetical protein
MATTYKLIDKNTLTSNQNSVSFTGLGAYSSDYTDLAIFISGRCTISDTFRGSYISFNGSTSNFSGIYLQGAGSGTPASGSLARYIGANPAATATANTFGNKWIYIPNYSSSNNKSFSVDSVAENNATLAFAELMAGLWSNTAAITSISFAHDVNDFATGSSFYLYGIKKN